MTTLAEVRDGIVARLETINGLRVVAYVPDDVPGYPAAVVFPPVDINPPNDLASGSFTALFVVMLFVPANIDRKQLDLYDLLDRGPGSVFAAIAADRTLGGLDVTVGNMSASDPLDRSLMASTQVYQRVVSVPVYVS
jgi:hypothetical protein